MAARWERQDEVSNAEIGTIPHSPERIAASNGARPTPKQEIALSPVMTTRSDMSAVRYHALPYRSTTRPAILLLILGTGAGIAAQAQPPGDRFDQLFARTLAKRQSIQSIRATFTETTVSSLLAKPLVAHGTVVAAPPARVLMTYTDPERRTVVIDGESLTVVWPDRRERETIDIAETQKRIDRYFTHATLAELRGLFEIKAESDASLHDMDRVEMVPKRKQIRQGLERLELWIDRETLLLSQMRMLFAGGDVKTIRLEDVTVNVPITDNMFRVPRF
jgi:outer membrane lipoprotein-sorting protein